MSEDWFVTLLSVSERDSMMSLLGQVGALVLAVCVGRLLLRSRGMIWVVAFLGAVGAIAANIVVDGQGAFGYLVFAPVVYGAAVVGRDDLRSS